MDFLNFEFCRKEREKIVEFQNSDEGEIKKDSNFFMDYMKKLLDYSKNNLVKKLEEKDLENNLLNIYYSKD